METSSPTRYCRPDELRWQLHWGSEPGSLLTGLRPFRHLEDLMWMIGQVVDDRNRALAGVRVEVAGPGATMVRTTVSNAQGQYVMQDLRPGVYTITFSLAGFATARHHVAEPSPLVTTVLAQLQRSEARQMPAIGDLDSCQR